VSISKEAIIIHPLPTTCRFRGARGLKRPDPRAGCQMIERWINIEMPKCRVIHKIVKETIILGSRWYCGRIPAAGESMNLGVLAGYATWARDHVIEVPVLRPPDRGRQRMACKHDHQGSEETTRGEHEPTR
jgi:hypothetical protein